MATAVAPRRSSAQTSNGGKETIDTSVPYIIQVTALGVAPLLFHAWNVESVEGKTKAPKGSKAKKTDNIESYAYRVSETDRRLGIPGPNLHASLMEAAKSMQDPRSPRKSLRDMIRAGVVPLDTVAPLLPDTTEWDYEDKRRATVQRAGITRTRPAMREGWKVQFRLLVNVPEYLNPELMASLINNAGRLVGLCDFRPTYGRFTIAEFEIQDAFED